jgi:hypothetical protein
VFFFKFISYLVVNGKILKLMGRIMAYGLNNDECG